MSQILPTSSVVMTQANLHQPARQGCRVGLHLLPDKSVSQHDSLAKKATFLKDFRLHFQPFVPLFQTMVLVFQLFPRGASLGYSVLVLAVFPHAAGYVGMVDRKTPFWLVAVLPLFGKKLELCFSSRLSPMSPTADFWGPFGLRIETDFGKE